MTKSTWLKLVTVAAALFIGGVAGAQNGGGGTNPDRDTGTPAASSTTTTSVQRKSTTTTDTRTAPADVKRSRDLENAPGGVDETVAPNADTTRH